MLAAAIAQLAPEAPAETARRACAAAPHQAGTSAASTRRALLAQGAIEALRKSHPALASDAGAQHADASAPHREPGWPHTAPATPSMCAARSGFPIPSAVAGKHILAGRRHFHHRRHCPRCCTVASERPERHQSGWRRWPARAASYNFAQFRFDRTRTRPKPANPGARSQPVRKHAFVIIRHQPSF